MKTKVDARKRNSKLLLSGRADPRGIQLTALLLKDEELSSRPLKEHTVYAYEVDDGAIRWDEEEGKKVQESLLKREWEIEKINDGLVTKAFITVLIMVYSTIVMFF